jgi:hypothetical protein
VPVRLGEMAVEPAPHGDGVRAPQEIVENQEGRRESGMASRRSETSSAGDSGSTAAVLPSQFRLLTS